MFKLIIESWLLKYLNLLEPITHFDVFSNGYWKANLPKVEVRVDQRIDVLTIIRWKGCKWNTSKRPNKWYDH